MTVSRSCSASMRSRSLCDEHPKWVGLSRRAVVKAKVPTDMLPSFTFDAVYACVAVAMQVLQKLVLDFETIQLGRLSAVLGDRIGTRLEPNVIGVHRDLDEFLVEGRIHDFTMMILLC